MKKIRLNIDQRFSINLFIGLIFTLLLCKFVAANEKYSVQGVVLSGYDNSPIPYAVVSIEGQSELRTRADDEGQFTLTLPQSGKYSLRASISGDLYGESTLVSIETKQNNKPLKLFINLIGSAAEITVTTESPTRQISAISISHEELNRVAGTAGDPLRAIQSLPGVAIGEDISSEPAVRGSFPGDNLYYVDFLPVGYLFHVGDSASVIQTEFIRDIDFYPSAFSAEYGDKIGAVFDINLIIPDRKDWQRTIDLGLLGISLAAQGPVTKNQSTFFGFRRSYLDLALDLIGDNENHTEDILETPTFTDYQGKYIWDINVNNIVSLNISGANDSLTTQRPGASWWIEDEDQSYNTQAVVWDSYWNNNSNKLAFGYLSVARNATDGPVRDRKIKRKILFAREQLQFQHTKKHFFIVGGDLQSRTIDYYDLIYFGCDAIDGCQAEIDTTKHINIGAAYLKDRWFLLDNLTLNLGARLSGNDLVKTFYLEPRLGIEWNVLPQIALTAAWGQYNQMPNIDSLIGNFRNPNLEHIRSEHSVLGLKQELNNGWSWKTEIYYKTMWNLLERLEGMPHHINNGNGEAYGAEFFLKKYLTNKFSGWLSVTASRTEITNNQTTESFLTSYDQPLIATLVFSSKLKNRWFIDLKWYFHSGTPYTPIESATPVFNEDDGEIRFYRTVDGKYNSTRYPAYHRLDVKVSKRMIFPHLKLEAYLGVINLFNRNNVNEYNYSFDYTSKSPSFQLPILPTFGINATF